MAKRQPPLSIFIACEGSNTEFLYLSKLNEVMEDEDHYPYAITIYPDKNKQSDQSPKTDALGLVKVAIERKKDYDEAWVVFDKDGYTKHEQAFELAADNNINIAFSSISIEIWILMHFERIHLPFSKSADIIKERFHTNTKYLPEYAKKSEFNVYPYIIKKTENAFKNAAFIKWVKSSKYPNHKIYELNPYSDIDILIKKMSLFEQIHKYIPVNHSVTLSEIEIRIIYNNNHHHPNFILEIKNLSQKSHVLNEFSVYNLHKERVLLSNKLINILETVSIELPLTHTNQGLPIYIEFEKYILEVGGI